MRIIVTRRPLERQRGTFSCAQNGGSCAGSSSLTSAWTCTFPLWYVADPTDGTATTTQYYNQAWAAAVQATNYVGMPSTITQSASTNTVQSFLASQLNTPAINFGSLARRIDDADARGNDDAFRTRQSRTERTLYGVSMCVYLSGVVRFRRHRPFRSARSSTQHRSLPTVRDVHSRRIPAASLAIQIPKSTSTATSSLGTTFWGLSIPGTIQLSGAYTGQNTFIAVRSSPSAW